MVLSISAKWVHGGIKKKKFDTYIHYYLHLLKFIKHFSNESSKEKIK